MPYHFFVWTEEVIAHLAEHHIAPGEFEQIVCDPLSEDTSHSSGGPVAFRYTDDGRSVMCVYELIDDDTVLPITAYEVEI